MKRTCTYVRKKWETSAKGALLSRKELHEIEAHLKTCSVCRQFAYTGNLSSLLQKSYDVDTPGPSERFFSGIRQKIIAHEAGNKQSMISDVLLQAGVRLVPIMAALLLFLTGTLAYVSKDTSQSNAVLTIEDIMFSEENMQVHTDLVLSSVFIEEVHYEDY